MPRERRADEEAALLPPMMPRWRGDVIFRATRSRATAAKSSKFWCFPSGRFCHAGPNSPPPRMFASDVDAATLEPALRASPV